MNNKLGKNGSKRDLSMPKRRLPKDLSFMTQSKTMTGGNHILYNASFRPHYYGMADFIEGAEIKKEDDPSQWNSSYGSPTHFKSKGEPKMD